MPSWLPLGGRRLLYFHKMCFPLPFCEQFRHVPLELALQDVGVIGSRLVAREVVVATLRVARQGLDCSWRLPGHKKR